MKTLSLAEYQDQTRDCTVLSRDEHGDKVLLRPDGRVIKLFRRKRLLSSALFVPYAARFARASVELSKRGIQAAIVEQTWRIPAIRRQAVVYPMLSGIPLRDRLVREPSRLEGLVISLAKFMATLHHRGVYFRAIHFGNLLTMDSDGDFVLIDISEARFHRGPLSIAWRARNFRPVLKYPEDRDAVRTFGPGRFVAEYLRACGLPRKDQDALIIRLQHMNELFASRS
jgi:hypothetical protein